MFNTKKLYIWIIVLVVIILIFEIGKLFINEKVNTHTTIKKNIEKNVVDGAIDKFVYYN